MASSGKTGSQNPPPLDCEVGLLIGYNCLQALLPREILSGEESHPYAQRTDLGWSIVGRSNPASDFVDAIGTSHRIIVRQVTPPVHPSVELKGEVHLKTCTLEISKSDFKDRTADDNPVSQRPYLVCCEKWDKAEGSSTRRRNGGRSLNNWPWAS